MLEIKAPNRHQDYRKVSIFLAGSIEQGKAEDWQHKLVQELSDLDIIVYNPRREQWDSTWIQSIHNKDFQEQVTWELNYLDNSDIRFYYFHPDTLAPISLMELGQEGPNGYNIVCCPAGYWRKGNIEVFCRYHDIPLYEDWNESVAALRELITNYGNG